MSDVFSIGVLFNFTLVEVIANVLVLFCVFLWFVYVRIQTSKCYYIEHG